MGRGPTPASVAEPPATERPRRRRLSRCSQANLSGDTETQPFADGLHDDLLTQLSKIGALKVISRTSVQEYRNTTKNVREISSELGVATVLEGGVQRAGDQYRINVQLIDADTDAHLWADQYSGELTTANIFDVQTDIATSIAEALQANLTAGEREQLERLPTESLEAYQYYQRARERRRFYEETDLRTGDRLASQAIELDPEFAEAWALKAVIATEIYWFYYDRSDSVVAAADRAVPPGPRTGPRSGGGALGARPLLLPHAARLRRGDGRGETGPREPSRRVGFRAAGRRHPATGRGDA